ncbi:MAG TPA: glycosyl hydrolase [Prolixibacteraceae bacterium]|nr:glycosyl hydrolase [Prolixibacteraceae bacterium]
MLKKESAISKRRILSFKGKLLLLLSIIFISTSAFSQIKSKKRGIAFGYNTESDFKALSKNISWWYNWSTRPESEVALVYQNYGMDFVPMTWNANYSETGLRAFYANHPEAKFILGFNEPNFTTQANMTPKQAAAAWPKLEKIAKDFGLKIVAPAVNYADKPVTEDGVTYSDPIKYLDAFFAACPTCQVDYIAVHNYMCYAGSLSNDIQRYKKYKKPIWLTEFACWDQQNITLTMQKDYMMGAIDYLEGDTCIFRYSWFNRNRLQSYPYLDLLKSTAGQLTELGQLYVNFNPIHDTSYYAPVPARLEAENYSLMSGISIQGTSDVTGIANVGWIDANDWMEYNIQVPETKDYNVYFRLASNASTNLELRENNVKLQALQIPSSGGWQSWKTLKTTVSLTAGKHKLRVFTNRGQFNMNWLEITNVGDFPTTIINPEQVEMRVYPNPVKDRLFIEGGNSAGKTEISIIDLSGRVITSQTYLPGTLKMEIDFSNYHSGSYIVRTKNAENISNHLIVK